MKIIENEKDTSTIYLNEIDKKNEIEYEIFNKYIPTTFGNFIFMCQKYLDSERNLPNDFAYYNIYDFYNTNPIQINNIGLRDNEDMKLNINLDRYKLFAENLITQLKNFSKLEANWDSYGAKKISWATIANAIDFFMMIVDRFPDSPIPFISPYPDGRIHVEWQKFSKELHHLIPKDNSNYFIYRYKIIDKKEGILKDYYDKAIGIDGMLRIFSIWYSND